MQQLSLATIPSDFYFVAFDKILNAKDHDESKILDSNIEKFNEDTSILNEILSGVIVSDPQAPVTKPFLHKCAYMSPYMLDAPGGTGKNFTIGVIQSILKLREQKGTAVARSSLTFSLLDEGRSAHSVFKIPIPCLYTLSAICQYVCGFQAGI